MHNTRRQTGISAVGSVPWGTHFCHFHDISQDLLEILTPYLQAGLENNEQCLCIAANSLNEGDLRQAMVAAYPAFEEHVASGQIKIVRYDDWYFEKGAFKPQKALKAWQKRLNQALSTGYDGLRVWMDICWLPHDCWQAFNNYEREAHVLISQSRALVLCSYPLEHLDPLAVLDVSMAHQFSLVKRNDRWEVSENVESQFLAQELQEQATLTQNLINAVPTPILYRDTNGVYLGCNKAFEQLRGIGPQQIAGKRVTDVMVLESAGWWLGSDTDVLLMNKALMYEGTSVLLEGSVRQMVVNKAPYRNSDGTVRGVVVTLNDVTERTETEERLEKLLHKLEASNERLIVATEEAHERAEEAQRKAAELETVINSIADGVMISDKEGNITHLNAEGQRLMGYGPEYYRMPLAERIAFNRSTFTDGQRLQPDDVPLARALRGETTVGREHVIWPPGMEPFFVSISAAPIYDQEGQIVGTVSIFSDITARKQSEQALKDSELRLRRINENMLDMIAQVDHRGCYEYISPSHKAVLGYDPKTLIGHSILDLAHPDDLGRCVESVSRAITEEVSAHMELRCRHANGHYVWLECVVTPNRAKDGQLAGAVLGLRDISARKLAEAQLKDSLDRLRLTLDGAVEALATTTDHRDPYTAGHQQRVAMLANAIGQEMGLSEQRLAGLRVAAKLHDIGKIHVPAEILSKPSMLSDLEMSMVRGHVEASYDILKTIAFPWPVADFVLQHHELLDGSGYPRGLSGEDILLETRILTVADVIEAMSSHRPYRPAVGMELALQELTEHRGQRYDPIVVDACLRLFARPDFELTADTSAVRVGSSW